jgi:hypothetical protein
MTRPQVNLSSYPKYIHNNEHRNHSSSKSQWTITTQEEYDSFTASQNQSWYIGDIGWGLYFIGQAINYLGISQNRQQRLFIAKFIQNHSPVFWHGYPADHMIHNQDIPPNDILFKWQTIGILELSKIRKLSRGQPCNL